MNEEKSELRCGKCGKVIPPETGGLDYAKISRILGANVYCSECEPPRLRQTINASPFSRGKVR